MISNLLRIPTKFLFLRSQRLFSNHALRRRIDVSDIRAKETRTNTFKHSMTDSVLKFDQLKAIYQKQAASTAITLLFENFEEIPKLNIDLLTRMNKNGINQPTEIQKNMLGHFFATGSPDLLIKSQPGSGKSLGYVIMLLSDYFKKTKDKIELGFKQSDTISFRYLIIVPSDLLAKQIGTWIEVLSNGNPINNAPKVSLLCETFQDLKFSNNCDFLIATPEVFRTKLAQGSISLKELVTVILDEADALIKPLKRYATIKQKEMRKKHPVSTMLLLSELFKSIASNKLLNRPRMIVASATLNNLTRDQLISAKLVQNPVFLEDRQPIITRYENLNPLESKVKHHHILLKDSENVNELIQILQNIIKTNLSTKISGKRGALFLPASQSKLGLCELLRSSPSLKDFSFGLLNEYKHHEQSQNSQLLIASDVDCRGIDIPELSFVIILDLPASLDYYIHMAGRVGRTSQDSGNVYTVLGTVDDFSRFSGLLRQIPLTSIPLLLE